MEQPNLAGRPPADVPADGGPSLPDDEVVLGWLSEPTAGQAASGVIDHLPFFYSLYFGIVALALAGLACRRHRMLSGLCLSALILAWLGGFSGSALLAISGGLFRSPEKLLFWPRSLPVPHTRSATFSRS